MGVGKLSVVTHRHTLLNRDDAASREVVRYFITVPSWFRLRHEVRWAIEGVHWCDEEVYVGTFVRPSIPYCCDKRRVIDEVRLISANNWAGWNMMQLRLELVGMHFNLLIAAPSCIDVLFSGIRMLCDTRELTKVHKETEPALR